MRVRRSGHISNFTAVVVAPGGSWQRSNYDADLLRLGRTACESVVQLLQLAIVRVFAVTTTHGEREGHHWCGRCYSGLLHMVSLALVANLIHLSVLSCFLLVSVVTITVLVWHFKMCAFGKLPRACKRFEDPTLLTPNCCPSILSRFLPIR